MLTKPWLCAISLPVSPACDSQGLARDRPGAPRVCALEELGIEPQKPTPKGIIARSGHQVCLAGHKGNLADDVILSRTLISLGVFTMEPIIVTNRESVILLGLTEARDLKGLKDRRPCYPSWPHLSVTEIGAGILFWCESQKAGRHGDDKTVPAPWGFQEYPLGEAPGGYHTAPRPGHDGTLRLCICRDTHP